MFLRQFAFMVTGLLASTVAAVADPLPWQTGFQPAVTPVMERIEDFHRLLLYIIVAVSLFVLALLVWIVIRYNKRSNPIPSKTAHNTLIEVAWTIIPVLILVGMWIERILIIWGTLSRGFMPSLWHLFYPTVSDWLLLFGPLGFFAFMFLWFIRLVPAVSMHEVRSLVRKEGLA